jgi:hypothetical protein
MPALFTSTSSAELRDRLLDHLLGASEVADVIAVGDRLTAAGDDLVDDLLRRPERCAGSVARAAEIVDHDFGAMRGQHQRVLAPNTATRAGDDDDSTITELRHSALQLCVLAAMWQAARGNARAATVR